MAKKKKFQETTIQNYYDLKTDKVDELVAALKGENFDDGDISMNISDCTGADDASTVTRFGRQKKFDPYKVDFLSKIPVWVKALFVKWWFAGAVCWFILMGVVGIDELDQMIICGVVTGMVTDILVNPLFRYMESDRKEYNPYIMFPFPFKAFWTFFTNIIYYTAVILTVNLCYTGISMLFGIQSAWVEPLLFGVFVVAADMAFIGVKDGIVYLVKKIRNRERTENV